MLRIATLNLMNNPDDIEERCRVLVRELYDKNVDFLCLQEVIRAEDTPGFDIIGFLSNELNLEHVETAKLDSFNSLGVWSGNVTLSRHPIVKHPAPETHRGVCFTESVINGRPIFLFNVHLAWGSRSEPQRLKEAVKVSRLAQQRHEESCGEAVSVMLGDFNTVEESATLQFLYSHLPSLEGDTALWVDAWKALGSPEDSRVTNDPECYWVQQTAAGMNVLHPERMPERRIDYVLVHEWCYGRAGSPMAITRFGDTPPTPSDHYGLCVDILFPPLLPE